MLGDDLARDLGNSITGFTLICRATYITNQIRKSSVITTYYLLHNLLVFLLLSRISIKYIPKIIEVNHLNIHIK